MDIKSKELYTDLICRQKSCALATPYYISVKTESLPFPNFLLHEKNVQFF